MSKNAENEDIVKKTVAPLIRSLLVKNSNGDLINGISVSGTAQSIVTIHNDDAINMKSQAKLFTK